MQFHQMSIENTVSLSLPQWEGSTLERRWKDVTNVHFVAAKRKRQNEKLKKNMPQFPFSITFSAAEMCAKFKGRDEYQGNYYSTPSITLYWRRQRSQLIFHYNESVSNEIDFLLLTPSQTK